MPPLTEEELRVRLGTLGASEIAIAMGVHPYQSPHQLWLTKMGLSTFEGNEATELGNELEPAIAAIYAKRYDKVLRKGSYAVGEEPWMSATPDYHIEGGGLAECKLVGIRTYWQWGAGNVGAAKSDAVPGHILLQGQWQMLITGEPFVDISALMGTEFRSYTLYPHEGIQRMLIERGREWWHRYVVGKTPPPVDGTEGCKEMLKALYPRAGADAIKATPEIEAIAEALAEAKRAVAIAEEKELEAANRMKAELKDARGAFGDGWRVRWAETKKGSRPFYFENDRTGKAA